MNSLLQFKIPDDLNLEFIIPSDLILQPITTKQQTKTYYDSFDWRLYHNGITAEFENNQLSLKTLKNNLTIATIKLNQMQCFVQQLPISAVRHQLEPVLEMRALLPICTLPYQYHAYHLLNDDKKTVSRLFIEHYSELNPRLYLQIIKGYDNHAEFIIKQLKKLNCTLTTNPILLSALKQQNNPINDYSPKLNIILHEHTKADSASKSIFSELLNNIQINYQGTITNIDTEFLHDFRVAVRRTRAALSQLKSVLPEDIASYYREFFSWLGTITSQTRDLDVYLLNFDNYKNSVPEQLKPHLNPLHEFLIEKQKTAQQTLATELQSDYYLNTISAWQAYLKQPITHPSKLSIKKLADKRLKKNYQRVLAEGNAINDSSPCEALHELRKSCKKLRYLLEFFQTLYDKDILKTFIKALKELQEVLGDFQDSSVQIQQLKAFSVEMHHLTINQQSFLAIDALINHLNQNKLNTRAKFSDKFNAFQQTQMQQTFQSLFE